MKKIALGILGALVALAAIAAPHVDPLAVLAVAPAAGFLGFDDQQPYRRMRRDLPAFENVVATGLAICKIPRYQRTLFAAELRMGGTTFDESKITDVRLRLGGSKTLWQSTGADLRKLNAYRGYYDGNRQFLWVDFTQSKSMAYGGEFVGGIDMSSLPSGQLTLEVTTSGATAPTLVAKGHWGPPGSGAVMQKLLKVSFSTSGTGRKVLPLNQDTFAGGRLRRIYAIYTTANSSWEQGTATSAAWSSNTGNGVMGTVTATVGAQVGVHKIVVVEPGANVGTFIHFVPDGDNAGNKGTGAADSRAHSLNSKSGVVASAYASGGLSFTLADGATDFVSGDGFDLAVSENNDGGISRMEVIKNGEAVWDFQCTEARQMQKQYGYRPQSLCYVVDFEVDGWPDGSLKTADAATLEIAATFTVADTATLYCEVLDAPANNIN